MWRQREPAWRKKFGGVELTTASEPAAGLYGGLTAIMGSLAAQHPDLPSAISAAFLNCRVRWLRGDDFVPGERDGEAEVETLTRLAMQCACEHWREWHGVEVCLAIVPASAPWRLRPLRLTGDGGRKRMCWVRHCGFNSYASLAPARDNPRVGGAAPSQADEPGQTHMALEPFTIAADDIAQWATTIGGNTQSTIIAFGDAQTIAADKIAQLGTIIGGNIQSTIMADGRARFTNAAGDRVQFIIAMDNKTQPIKSHGRAEFTNAVEGETQTIMADGSDGSVQFNNVVVGKTHSIMADGRAGCNNAVKGETQTIMATGRAQFTHAAGDRV
ncbi:hypothetical protein GGR56DRAFT_671943 [Xylariaceae sp. FL0804]|nr:hypothetical protein GGR56DRAFT_671943 [Xylariaceae sp. FL0804]